MNMGHKPRPQHISVDCRTTGSDQLHYGMVWWKGWYRRPRGLCGLTGLWLTTLAGSLGQSDSGCVGLLGMGPSIAGVSDHIDVWMSWGF